MATSQEPARPRALSSLEVVGPFPDAERVIYDHNTLGEVLCQVKFPPVLRIEAELPAQFQDRIRDVFEIYKDSPATVLGGIAGVQMPEQVLQLVRNAMPALQ